MKNITLIACGGIIAMTSAAHAVHGPYVGAGFGFNRLGAANDLSGQYIVGKDPLVDEPGNYIKLPVYARNAKKNTPAFSVAAGYDFGNVDFYIPARLHIDYTRNTKNLGGMTIDQFDDDMKITVGDISADSIMASLFWEFKDASLFRVTPFAGVGAGLAFVKQNLDFTGGYHSADWAHYGAGTMGPLSFDESATSFAWSVSAGLTYAAAENLFIDLTYRYTDYGAQSVGPTEYSAYQQATYGFYETKSRTELHSHGIMLGARWRFGMSNDAPVAPLSYFAFDKSEPDDAWRESAAIFAKSADKNQKYSVVGHTDNIGSAEYNSALSRRRANAAADYLTSLGIARENLVTVGRGFDEPVADNATADGRAKNRRTEITEVK